MEFTWDSEAEKAFQQLKRMSISAPTLSFLSEGELILDTDASGTAIGAVLSQKQRGNIHSFPAIIPSLHMYGSLLVVSVQFSLILGTSYACATTDE